MEQTFVDGKGGTNIAGGIISTDSTWTLAGSPYHVNADLTIAAGATLHIEAGVVVKFNDVDGSNYYWTDLIVKGVLDVQATASNKVVFTSIHDDSHGGDSNGNGNATSPAPGQWGSIRYQNSANNLQYCLVRYGGYLYNGYDSKGSIYLNACSPEIKNCIIEYSERSGIYGVNINDSYTLENDTLRNNSNYGIELNVNQEVTVNNNFINDCGKGIIVNGSGAPNRNIHDNIIENTGNGITINCSGNSIVNVNLNQIQDGTGDGIVVNGSQYNDIFINDNNIQICAGTGIALKSASSNSTVSNNILYQVGIGVQSENVYHATISNNTITQYSSGYPYAQINTAFPIYSSNTLIGSIHKIKVSGNIDGSTIPTPQFSLSWDQFGTDFVYVIENDLTVANTTNPTTLCINPGTIIKFNDVDGISWYWPDLIVNGVLDVQATASNKVVFTSIHDDSFGGDSNGNGNATSPAPGQWGSIRYQNSANNLQYCLIRYGGGYHNGTDSKGAVYLNGCSPIIKNCIIEYSERSGIYGVNINDAYTLENDTLRNNSNYGIELTINQEVTLKNNFIKDGGKGIFIDGSGAPNRSIHDNVIENTGNAITINCSGNSIVNVNLNQIQDGTGDGIVVNGSQYNDIFINDNNIQICAGTGIALKSASSNSTVSNNILYQVGIGVQSENVYHATISNNTITQYSSGYPYAQINTAFPIYSSNTLIGSIHKIKVSGNIDGSTIPTPQFSLSWDQFGTDFVYVIENDLTVANTTNPTTLHVNPGTIIKFNDVDGISWYWPDLIVNGVLDVQATASNKVVFTSIHDDSFGGDSNGNGNATSPAAGQWGRILFQNSNNNLQYCLIRYGGGYHNGTDSKGAVYLNGCSPIIKNCIIEYSERSGIYGVNINDAYTLENDTLRNNSNYGIELTINQEVTLKNNFIKDGGKGIFIDGSGAPNRSIHDNVIENTGNAITINCSGNSIVNVNLNQIQDGTGDGIVVNGSQYNDIFINDNNIQICAGTGIALKSASSNSTVSNNILYQVGIGVQSENVYHATISNNTITQYSSGYPYAQINTAFPIYSSNTLIGSIHKIKVSGNIDGSTIPTPQFSLSWDQFGTDFVYVIENDLTVANTTNPTTLHVNPGTIIKFNDVDGISWYWPDLIVNGVLDVQATASNKVVFTSIHDDSFGGDSNGNGNATSPAAGQWGRILFQNSNNNLQYCLIRYGGGYHNGTDSKGAVYLNGCSPIIKNCIIEYSERSGIYGVNINDATISITNCTLKNSSLYGIYLQNSSNCNVFLEKTIAQDNNYGAYLENTSANITHCSFSDNTIGLYAYGNSNPSISNTLFKDNSNIGVWVKGNNSNPLPVINNNNFENNTNYHIKLEAYSQADTTVVNAQNNWFDSADSLTIAGKLYHNPDNTSSATLNWTPYLFEEDEEANAVYCPADINMDAAVNGSDLALLGFSFGQDTVDIHYNADADIDESGRVDGFDLAILGLNFGTVGSCLTGKELFTGRNLPLITLESDVDNTQVGDTMTVWFNLSEFEQPFAFITNINIDTRMLEYCGVEKGSLLSENGQNQTTLMETGNNNYRMLGITRMDVEGELLESSGCLISLKFIKKEELIILNNAILLYDPLLMNGFGEWAGTIDIQYGNPTSINPLLKEEEFVHLYPNPFNNQLSVAFTLVEDTHIKQYLVNTNGQISNILRELNCQTGDYHWTFNMPELPKGLYLFIMELDGQRVTKKIIHQ